MKLKAVSGMMLTLLFMGILTLAFNVQQVKSDVIIIYVDDDNTAGPWYGTPSHPYQNITSALQNASVNDTIYVYNGTYYENVVINKTLTLTGENRSNTIINGSGLNYTGALVAIKADNVNMSGFTVTNALLQGIEVEERQYCEVHDNIVCFTGDRGIVFGSAHNNKAYGNIVYNSSAYGGIDAVWSSNNTIYNNIAYFNQWGISTNHGSHNLIYNNTVYSNEGVGIHIDWPSTGNIVRNNNVSSNTHEGIRVINQNETVISGNKISENEIGIWLANSSSNNIFRNNITANTYDGIFLSGSSNNSIVGNNITNNFHGIRLVTSSHNNTIEGNDITNNGNGILLSQSPENSILGNNITDNTLTSVHLQESSNNSFYYNNFVTNTLQVFINQSINTWDNGYPSGGNYWSNYTGVDADGDGIGDTPYVIDENNKDNYPLRTRVLRVPEDYSTIEEAKEAANPGDTITIAPGIYNESLVINKTLRILGIKGSDPEFAGGESGIAVTLLQGASGSIVAGIVITNWDQGIFIKNCSDCKIYDNIMSSMGDSGMALEGNNAANNIIYSNTFQDNSIAINLTESSTSNTIHSNTISLNDIGLDLVESSGNTIYANTISENEVAINMSNSNDNTIYWNNFESNTQQVIMSNSFGNVWDNGYPSGGNYWSDYEDIYPDAEEIDDSGIWDTPYVIYADNVDNYPLMEPWTQPQPTPVGGISIPVDKFSLLAPYIALVSTILVATAATAIYVKRVKHRKEK